MFFKKCSFLVAHVDILIGSLVSEKFWDSCFLSNSKFRDSGFLSKVFNKFKEQVNLPEHLGNFCKKNFLAAIGETGTVRFPSFLKRLYSTQHFSGLPVISLFEEIKESAV